MFFAYQLKEEFLPAIYTPVVMQNTCLSKARTQGLKGITCEENKNEQALICLRQHFFIFLIQN